MDFITYYKLEIFYEIISGELSEILSALTLNEICKGYDRTISGKEYADSFHLIMDYNSTDDVIENCKTIIQKLVNREHFYCEYTIKFSTDNDFMHPSYGRVIPVDVYIKVMKENPEIIKKKD